MVSRVRARWNQWKYRPRPQIDLNQIRLGVTRWTLIRGAFALMVFGQIFGFYLVDQNSKDDLRRACERGNDTRQVISEVIDLTGDPSATDLTVVPGFSDLDLPTQKFLINLRDMTADQAASAQEGNKTFRDMAAVILEPREC